MSSAFRSRAELAASLAAALLDPADAAELEVHGRRNAAVLIPLYLDGGDPHAVFTRRRDDLRLHPGQISFPGGSQDDDENLRDTALREACEEIGLSPDGVEIVGALKPTPTFVTDFAVYPFVGLIESGQSWKPSDSEVAEVLEPSVAELREGWAERPVETSRGTFTSDTYLVGEELIWGATARIVTNLLRVLP